MSTTFIKAMQITFPEKEAELSPEGDLSIFYKAVSCSCHIKAAVLTKHCSPVPEREYIKDIGSCIF